MQWVLGGLALLVVAVLLRRVLALDVRLTASPGFVPLSPEREALYQPVAQELEAHATILGVSLNDAFEERDAGRMEISWRLVSLAAGEWDRASQALADFLQAMASNLPRLEVAVPLRTVSSHRFKSQVMADFIRTHELLDQLIIHSKLRFQLHVRMLRRGNETLTSEFRRVYHYGERTGDRPPELWQKLDRYFHDFDLLGKESLLALRAFLACLPDPALRAFAEELQAVTLRGVRTPSMLAGH